MQSLEVEDEALLPDAKAPGNNPPPGKGADPLSFRAVAIGLLVGMITATMNVSFSLKAGWSQGGSILAAVVSIGTFSALRTSIPFTPLEANICQTAASAGGTMTMAAGLGGPIPALKMLGYNYSTGLLMVWAFSVSYLGVFFAVPLRRTLVVKENLRFPTGLATYHTICSMFAEGGEATARSRLLLRCGIAAGLWTLLAYFAPWLEKPQVLALLGLSSLANLGWGLNLDVQLIGGGVLCGTHVGCSILFGAVMAWGVIAPAVRAMGWAPGPYHDYGTGVRGWILWPGVALMVGDALSSLAISIPWRHVLPRALGGRPVKTELGAGDAEERGADGDVLRDIPNSWAATGLALSVLATSTVLSSSFGLPWWQPLFAVPCAALLSYIAVRCSGETDINPVGGMGKVTQLAFAAIAPHQMVTNLMAAAVVGAAASQAGDLSQDFACGKLMRTSPRKQFIAQIIGIPFGVLAAVPVYRLFEAAYEFGGPEAPAPAAQAWKAVAQVLSNGFAALPPHSGAAMVVAALVGASLPVLSRGSGPSLPPELACDPGARAAVARWRGLLPSGTSLGLAFIIYPDQALAIAVGSLVLLAWRRRDPVGAEGRAFSAASGMIAGGGLMGVVNAVLALSGVPRLGAAG